MIGWPMLCFSQKMAEGRPLFCTLTKLWSNLCGDVGEKEEEGLLLFLLAFLRMNAFSEMFADVTILIRI